MRTWDGTAFGAATVIPTNGLTAWNDDLRVMTGMFFQNGKLYFTRSGSLHALLPLLHPRERHRGRPAAHRERQRDRHRLPPRVQA